MSAPTRKLEPLDEVGHCDGTMETLHLLRSPANAARLLNSIAEANAGTGSDGLP